MKKIIVSCFDIGEVPRSPGKRNWNWLFFLPFIFTFEQGGWEGVQKIKTCAYVIYECSLCYIRVDCFSWTSQCTQNIQESFYYYWVSSLTLNCFLPSSGITWHSIFFYSFPTKYPYGYSRLYSYLHQQYVLETDNENLRQAEMFK